MQTLTAASETPVAREIDTAAYRNMTPAQAMSGPKKRVGIALRCPLFRLSKNAQPKVSEGRIV